MKRLISIILALFMVLGSTVQGIAVVTLGEGDNAVSSTYRTSTLTEYVSEEVNPCADYGLNINQRIPNYLGTIRAELSTSEGSGSTQVIVIYVPDDKWDGECYYSGITATIRNSGEYHLFTGYETVVNWKEWYNYGFLPGDGGVYVFDPDAVQMNFLSGPGLYTAYASIPYSLADTGAEDYMTAYALAPESFGMTALGYPFLLLLNDTMIEYYLENGKLEEGAAYGWPELASLLDERREIIEPSGASFGFHNFVLREGYRTGTFLDMVNSDKWYDEYVRIAYELGLMTGYTDHNFRPEKTITLAEAITIAATVRDIYFGGSGSFTAGFPWYSMYVNYAVRNGIINEDDFDGYDRPATRGELSYIFANALPDEAYENVLNNFYFKDVDANHRYYNGILKLYNAGIITGYTDKSFRPESEITRAEIATMVAMIVDVSKRNKGNLNGR